MITLDNKRIRLAEAIFDVVVTLPPERRPTVLAERCGSDMELRTLVEQLIQSDERASLSSSDHRVFRPAANLPAPDRIGSYRIVRSLGEGGMGVVYEAEQEHPRRSVALKMLRPGILSPRAVQRFEHEADLLGQLQHPGIAQVFEAGTTEVTGAGGAVARHPFFAMELVRGRTLIEFARETNLSIAERLALVARVCDAVQHAHQKGVIHRDLKPANILVNDERQPKILDFGVARSIGADLDAPSSQTLAGQLLGTIPYMSPEQLEGDCRAIDTRSDVYSLGVVAFELLTGRLPFDVADVPSIQAIRILSQREPLPAGAVRPELRGDVEAIIGKALERNPDRRYPSCAELAADIRRYLRNETVLARPPSGLHQLAKFARRNRGLVAGAAVAALALMAGTIGTATFAWRESREAERAEAQAARAESITRFLREMLASANPQAMGGPDVTVRQVLDEAAARLHSGELSRDPETTAALHNTIGESYLNLGDYREAKQHLQAAVALFSEQRGQLDADVILNMCRLATANAELQVFDEAEKGLRDALALSRQLHGERHLQVALVQNDLGACYSRQSKFAEAEECHRQALALRRSLPDATPLHAAESLNNLGDVLQSLGKLAEAEPLLRESLAIRRERLPSDHLHLANVLNNLGTLLKRLDRLDEAEAMLREALEICRRRMDPNHPEMAVQLNNLANLLQQRDRCTEATNLMREAISIQSATFGPDHADVGRARLNLAHIMMAQGDYENARRESEHGLRILRGVFGDRHTDVAFSLHNIAAIMSQRGEAAEAEPMLREAVDIVDERIGRQSDVAAHLRDSLGVTLVRLERYEDAIPVLEEALDRRREVLGEKHAKVGISGCNLAVARLRSGDAPGAVDVALRVLPILRARKGLESQLATTLLVLVEARMELNDPLIESEAEDLVGEAVTLFQPLYGDGSIQAADAQRLRGVLLTRRGQFDEAEAVLTEAIRSLDARTDKSPTEHGQTRRRAVEAMTALYRAWGKPEQADQYTVAP